MIISKFFAPVNDRRAPWTAHGVGSMLSGNLFRKKFGGDWCVAPVPAVIAD